MSPTEEHAALIDLIQWIDKNLSGVELPTDERSMLAVGCFDVAIEHQAAVAVLFSSGLYGSMFALLRVLTESLVRGLWLLLCATEAELSQFKNGRVQKEFGALISEVENHLGGGTVTLSNLKANAWKAMNGFTHTGFNQVSRRHGDVYRGGQLSRGRVEAITNASRIAGSSSGWSTCRPVESS